MSYLDTDFDDVVFNPKELMKQIKTEINTDKTKLNEFRNSIYYDCMKKIKNALNIGETDIFYKVPSEIMYINIITLMNVYITYKIN